MSESTPEFKPPIPWQRLHAFGLPAGSIRAVLALLIFSTVWALLLLKPGREVPDFLRDLLFIIMGHYFAARHRVPAEEPGPPPLFLPRGTIRIVTIVGFAAVAILLFQRGELKSIGRNPGALTLVLIAGFLMGVVLAKFSGWLRDRGHRPPRSIEDIKALAAIIAALVLVALVWNRFLPEYNVPKVSNLLGAPRELVRGYGPEHVLAAVVGFYYGSRS